MVRLGLLYFIVLLLWPGAVFGRKYLMTKEAFDRATSMMKADAVAVAALPGLRPGSTPIYKLHPVGSYVHGTVVVFHGFAGNAITTAQQAQYLYDSGFNVYAGNLPGFAQTENYWLRPTLRDTAGYSEARSALFSDERMQNAIRVLSGSYQSFGAMVQQLNGSKLVSVVREIIERELPSNVRDDVLAALDLISPFRSATSADFFRSINKYFFSEHTRYESAISALSTVQPLPGPLYMMGFSFGGPNVVNVLARSRSVERAVLLAPYFGNRGVTSDLTHFYNIAGVLDMFKFNIFGQTISASSIAGFATFSQMVVRDEILHAARESTRVLCIMAEDDTQIDVMRSREICDSKLGGRSLMFPKRFGLDHLITPELGNKYSNAMLQQVVSFFVNGTASESALLKPNDNVTL